MKMKNFKINSENITNIAARIVVAVGIIVLVVVAFKLAAFLLTKILFPLLGGVIQILFEATSWIIPLFLISRKLRIIWRPPRSITLPIHPAI